MNGEKRPEMKQTIIIILVFCTLFAGCSVRQSEVIPSKVTAPPLVSEDTAQTNGSYENIVDPNRTYGYEQMISDSEKLKETYPDIISTETIGKSVEGRDILLIKLGKGDKKLVLAGAHHAREYITSTFLMETIDEYAWAYETSGTYGEFDIKELLDEATVYIVPMVNPDGVNLVQNGIDSAADPDKVKSMNMLQNGYDKWKANINGVDLNRQYPCFWDAKGGPDGPSSENYKGMAPATEPEVKAMMKLCNDNEFLLGVSFHTKGEVIYWADSGTEAAIPADNTIAQTLADVTGYSLMPVSEDPAQYAAGFENWFRQDFAQPAFCVELTPSDNSSAPHDDSQFITLVWSKAKYLCADLIYQAVDIK